MEYRTVLVATDGSKHAMEATAHACDLADRHDATLHVIHVMDVDHPEVTDVADSKTRGAELKQVGEDVLESTTEVVADQNFEGPVETRLLEGVPYDEVLTYAEDNDVDVIVVGRRGRSESIRLPLGGTTDAIIRHTAVPVFVCP